ncbi:MAG: flagellar hook-basal body complex protein FliE [Gemmataceae bacterium]
MDIRGIANGLPLPATPASTAPGAETSGQGFTRVMDRLLDAVARPQHDADQSVLDLTLGRTDQMHQVLLNVARADLTFRLMLEVRNRLTEAWQEIQRMQI